MIIWHTDEPPAVAERFKRLAQKLHRTGAATATATWQEGSRIYGVHFAFGLDTAASPVTVTITGTLQIDLPLPTDLATKASEPLIWTPAHELDAGAQWYMLWQQAEALVAQLSAEVPR